MDDETIELSVALLNGSSDVPITKMMSIAPIEQSEVESAAAIFVRVFRRQVERLFSNDSHARRFYRDLLELVRLKQRDTFFVARASDQSVAGFLALVLPQRRPVGSYISQLTRMTLRLATGSYGVPLRIVRHAMSRATTSEPRVLQHARRSYPLVYVVAMDERWTGQGVGSALLAHARDACLPHWNAMWLLVESDNQGAIRFYERHGFRLIGEHDAQLAMLWRFDEEHQ